MKYTKAETKIVADFEKLINLEDIDFLVLGWRKS